MYEAPRIDVMGRLHEVTLGPLMSRCDGNSGTVGNPGMGNSGCGTPGNPMKP